MPSPNVFLPMRKNTRRDKVRYRIDARLTDFNALCTNNHEETSMQTQLAAALFATLIACSMPARSADDTRIATGGKVFAANCKSCHDTGKAENDAPQISETAEWKSRLGGGREALYKSSIQGFSGYFTMPAKGGNASLSDDEVKAAVDYMLDKASVR